MNSFNKKHIGLTGYNAAGKGEVAGYLQKHGYLFLSLSDLLREKAKALHLELTRENLTQLGQKLRKESNPGFLADMAIEKLQPNKAYVIDSIRHPDEITALKNHLPNFFLIGVDAPVDLRFQRSQVRGRAENAHTLEEFIERENQEKKNRPNAQQLHKCMDMADAIIVNDGNIKHLEDKIQEVLS